MEFDCHKDDGRDAGEEMTLSKLAELFTVYPQVLKISARGYVARNEAVKNAIARKKN